jgi:hypothetical protein
MVALLQDWEKGNSSIKALPPPKKAERLIETTAFTSLKGWKAPVKLLTPVVSDVNYQEDVNGYFNTSFASKLQSSIVFEIIQILSDTFCVSQVRTVSLCLPVCYLSFSLFVFLSLFSFYLSIVLILLYDPLAVHLSLFLHLVVTPLLSYKLNLYLDDSLT